MNEQELIIQGNQASVLMPKLKRYIDEQIAALSGGVASKAYVDEQIAALSAGVASKVYVDEQIAALSERDKDTLFINFSEVSSSERQTILFFEEDSTYAYVYNNAEIPEGNSLPPETGTNTSIAQGIYDKYHESYPWLETNNVAKKVVAGYIALVPTDGEIPYNTESTPWLRLGYSSYIREADVMEQHLKWLSWRVIDSGGSYDEEREDIFAEGFLTSSSIPLKAMVGHSKNVVLKGWILLKNS